MFIEALLLRVPARFSSPGNGLKKKIVIYSCGGKPLSSKRECSTERHNNTDKSQHYYE